MNNTARTLCLLGGLISVIAAWCGPLSYTDVNNKNKGSHSLHYDRPAEFFEEALVIGNGRLGATLYGGPATDRISLNDITLWTGEPEGEVFNPDAHQAIPAIRAALEGEDYRTANKLNRQVQGHYSENYQPLGTLMIEYADSALPVSDYSRRLDLGTATATTDYKKGDVRRTVTTYASAPDSVIVVNIRASEPWSATVKLTSLLPHEVKADGAELISDGYAAYNSIPSYVKAPQRLHYDAERGIHFSTIVHAVNNGGSGLIEASDSTLRLDGVTDVTLLLTNATSFNGPFRDPVREGKPYKEIARRNIDDALRAGEARLRERQLADYQRFYSRVSVDFGTTPDSVASLPTDVQLRRYTDLNEYNPDLEETYFQFGRYLLISCSRTEGVPANLQGLWNERLLPPWSSNYTTNINVEENYWPAEVTGLGEMQATAMIPWIEHLSHGGQTTARHYYGVGEGWALGHNSDIWAMTNPVGEGKGDPKWACWGMGSPWVASHIWEHYQFTRDRDFLEKYYPVLRGAARYGIGSLVEHDGHLITSPSTSPENVFITPDGYKGATLYGATADLAIIRQCLLDTRAAANVLGRDEELVAEIDNVLSRMYPYKIGKNGNLQEWYHDWEDADPTHRHQSHLYGLFPGRHLTPETTPALAEAARRTLEMRGDKTTGWSTGWRVNLLARLHDGEGAYRMYRTLLRYVSPDNYRGDDRRTGGGTYPNLLDAHSPFQIDGNFGGTAGVAEMLIQSSSVDDNGEVDTIMLLPALPEAWSTGRADGLRARGAFVVDMAWDNGEITELTVSSLAGGTVALEGPGLDDTVYVTLEPGEKQKIR